MTSFSKDIYEDIYNTVINIKFEFMKHVKRKRFLIVIFLAIVTPAIFYIIPEIQNTDFPESVAEFANTNLGFINWLIVISAAVFAGDAISSEFENKTGLILFASPQRRTSILVGKYFAALIATFLGVIIYYMVTALEIFQIYGFNSISLEFNKSLLIALIYTISVFSVIYFFSCVLKRTITSALIGFFLFVMILPIISGVLKNVDIEPWFLLTYSGELIQDVLIVPNSISFGPGRHMNSVGGFEPELFTGLMVMVFYSVFFYLTGIIIANKRGME
jgi:ABC-type transport system involved in multi-copper enzyme maturation permease subunit